MAKHIVLFSGSFNPMHIGHLCLANYVVEMLPDVGELWLIVTPTNPFKAQSELLDEEFRVRWATYQVSRHPKLKVSTVELSLPKPNYTYRTISHLKETYPDHKFTLLVGLDSLLTMPKWYEGSRLMTETDIIVYPRPGYDAPPASTIPNNVTIVDAPVFDISATELRHLLLQGHALPYFLNIDTSHHLYTELLDQLRRNSIK
ncbi:nicotinate (nicotinamide) nucleotide adenylyltransferase [Porphyromonas sp.]|uniref:nicotinate (nicotinamide) nucleotide adenylyltransferase n=1 Tax=Porphyromonas sp. TaxID=1924944 RepID=UPI0026DC714F|nr:nicotinate (nicotinamide) nucleotide adenylyltransferase [Porphyromonas sp.]MDO4695280.1 nicotinate (nicotinamide) nucleotide adenylyltransferase [Porphyromonas sp.]MDO4770682.1 nicotinate (nicotinamide) nucleotide adenylyltransferase [Porphyromonas sp.]